MSNNIFICKICGKELNGCLGLSSHIRRTHLLSSKDYYDQYLKQPHEGECPICGNQTKFYRLGKGYLKYCSTKCLANSEETREKAKQTCLKNYGVENPYQSEEIKSKIKETNLNKYGNEHPIRLNEFQEKIKETCLNKYGVSNISQSYEINKLKKSKYFYNNIWFDSSWELAYYIYLTDNNISFIYHPNISFKYYYNNKEHLYFPDFSINNEFIDIKGDQFFDKDILNDNIYNIERSKARNKCIEDNNIKLIRRNDIKPIIKYITDKYGSTYLKSFKRKKE